MSILQISKIQQRSGNLVDLPQLDNAEFGWANDSKRLFIGKTSPNENVEILTSYSNIYFSQISGSYGNLNINPTTLAAGEILVYDGTNWVNGGGVAGGNINLGNVSNVAISGGATGYVLQTDGLGNLSWTPKNTLIAYIENVTKANPAVVTTVQNHNLTNAASITITGAQGMTQLNGMQYYVGNLSPNTFSLYSDGALTSPVNSTSYTAYAFTSVSNTTTGTNYITVGNSAVLSVNKPVQFVGSMSTSGILANTTYYINSIPNGTSITVSNTVYANGTAGPIFALQTANGLSANVYETGGQLTSISSGGSGSGLVSGTDTQIQYNSAGSFGASSSLTFNYTSKILTVNGNANVGNLNATTSVTASTLASNIATGTSPITVNSTTKVANLNADFVDGYNTSITTSANTIPVRDANGNINSNIFVGNTLSLVANANVGNLGFGLGVVTGTGNITAGNIIGTIAAGSNTITTTGNVTAGNVISNLVNGTSAVTIATSSNVTLVAAGSNVLTVTGTGANITGTLNTTGIITGNGSGLYSIAGANVIGTVANANSANTVLTNSSVSTTAYPTFVTSSSNGYYSSITASGINANLANSSITATTFVGTLSGTATSALNASNASAVLQNTSTATTVYPKFTTSSANGNSSSVISTGISANLANNSITATTFIGTLVGTATSISNATSIGVTTQSTGIYYPTFSPSSSTGNYALAANSGISANLANGAVLATTFVGALSGAATSATTAGTVISPAQPNITSVGTLTGLTVGNATSNIQFGNGTINATGNIQGFYFIGNGSQLTGITTGSSTIIVNGTSNVSIPSSNSNIYLSVNGTSNVITVTSTAANVNGNVNVTGNVVSINLGGNLTTAAQPNITSVGTLTVLNVTGNISGANVNGNHFGNHFGNGSGLSSITGANVTGYVPNANVANTVSVSSQPNITSLGTLTGLSSGPALFTASGVSATVDVTTPNSGGTTGGLRVRGNSVTGNALIQITDSTATNEWSHFLANSAGFMVYNSTFNPTTLQTSTITTGANTTAGIITGTWTLSSGSTLAASSATIAGTVTTAAQPNITSATNLASIGTITTGVWQGSPIQPSYVATLNQNTTGYAATVSVGAQPNITSATNLASIGTITTGVWQGSPIQPSYVATLNQNTTGYAATVTTAAQPNITSATNLASIGTITTGVWQGSPIQPSYVATLNQNTTGYAATVSASSQPNITSLGTLANLTVSGFISGANINGNHFGNGSGLSSINAANVIGYVPNANVANTVSVAAQPNITSATNLASIGTITTGVWQGSPIQPSYVATLNQNTTGYAATVSASAQPNITSLGTLANLTVSGFISATGSNTQIGSLGVGTVASGTSGEIRATNNITAYYSSDKRLKENIIPIANAIEKISQISGVEFDWTQDYLDSAGGEDGYFVRKHDVGVLAQEIQQVLPEAVAEREDGILAVKYERVVPLLIEAIKQQQKQIEDLQSMISIIKS